MEWWVAIFFVVLYNVVLMLTLVLVVHSLLDSLLKNKEDE